MHARLDRLQAELDANTDRLANIVRLVENT